MRIGAVDRDRILKICRHELGHFFVAKKLGFKTTNLTFTFHKFKGHLGGAGLEPNKPGIETIEDIINYLELRIVILYAGVISEATDNHGNYDSNYALNQWHKDGGMQDHAKIRELTFLLRGILHPETTDNVLIQNQLDSIDTGLIQRSGEIVIENIEVIYDAAYELSSKIILFETPYNFTDQEVTELLSEALK